MSIRLLSLVLVTLGSAHAAEWHPLPVAIEQATPQGRGTLDSRGIPRIINGTLTSDFPAVAGLVIAHLAADMRTILEEDLCTGTLVSPSVILTAAHCIGDGPVAISATFCPPGSCPDGSAEEQRAVLAFAVNPKLRFPRGDLALLLLESPVVGITPVPLATRKARPRSEGTIVGYGMDEVGNLGLKEMGTVRLKRCPRKVPALGLPAGSLNRSLCWQARAGEQNTCHGDSGGPLLIGDSLAGVTSGGDADCTGFLSWDTNVVPYLHWIRSHLR